MMIIFSIAVGILIADFLLFVDTCKDWEFYTKKSGPYTFKKETKECKWRFAICAGVLLLDIIILLLMFI